MWKQVLPLFVIAVLFGWMMPARDPVAKSDVEAVTTPESAKESAANASNSEGGFADVGLADTGELVLNRAENGHFYANGNADGAAIRFMVDTGASVVALTEADAELLGHFLNPGELTVVGRGVNGEVQGKPVTISRLNFGSLSADNVPAVIIPEGLPVSLLGQSFLSRVAHVTISDNKMTLKN